MWIQTLNYAQLMLEPMPSPPSAITYIMSNAYFTISKSATGMRC